jgi:hypothetical protein
VVYAAGVEVPSLTFGLFSLPACCLASGSVSVLRHAAVSLVFSGLVSLVSLAR